MQYEKRRAQILETAFETFLSYGFRRTSLEQIAEQVGVSRPALYRYFDSKENLFRALVDRFLGEALARVEVAASRSEGKAVDERLLSVLQAWYEESAQIVLSSPHGIELMEADRALCGEVVEQRTESLVAILTRILRDSRQPQAKRTARMLFAASKGFLTHARSEAEFRTYLRDLTRLVR
ncbi:MAG: helix-turn-helix domain-containing protein [Myxococcota bacterium]